MKKIFLVMQTQDRDEPPTHTEPGFDDRATAELVAKNYNVDRLKYQKWLQDREAYIKAHEKFIAAEAAIETAVFERATLGYVSPSCKDTYTKKVDAARTALQNTKVELEKEFKEIYGPDGAGFRANYRYYVQELPISVKSVSSEA